mgnify:FL=1
MKKLIAKTFVIRVLSLFTLLLLCIMEALPGNSGTGFRPLCANLIAACGILMLHPLSYEESTKSLRYAILLSLLSVAAALSGVFPGNECLMLTLVTVFVWVAYCISRSRDKYNNVRMLFRLDFVWCAVEDYSRLFYLLVLCALSVSALTACRFEGPSWLFFIHLLLLLSFYSAMYVRVYKGRSFVMSPDKEAALKEMIKGNLRTIPEAGEPDEHMNSIYGKVLRYMDSKKPYLQESFTIEDLADAVFTNKVYLSKTINYFSGRNYRQFINYYRVNHAKALMQKDRHLKVVEIAMMSGFHSVVTFNMAFKLFTNMTPTAYYGMLAAKEKPQARTREQERLTPAASF